MQAMTCKFKNFLILVISVGITSLIFLSLVRDQPVDIQTLVTETHKQFKSLQVSLTNTNVIDFRTYSNLHFHLTGKFPIPEFEREETRSGGEIFEAFRVL